LQKLNEFESVLSYLLGLQFFKFFDKALLLLLEARDRVLLVQNQAGGLILFLSEFFVFFEFLNFMFAFIFLGEDCLLVDQEQEQALVEELQYIGEINELDSL
jgi:hypothetical protein